MSIALPPAGASLQHQSASTSRFEEKLDIAKSSQILVDYLERKGKSAINSQELALLANHRGADVPAEVSAAAA